MDATRTIELIQRDLDGELSPAERAELARLLLADPEAHRLQEALRRTHKALQAVPAVTPPARLRPAILARLGLSPPTGAGGSGDTGGTRGPLLRYAAIAAGALLVAGLGYGLLDRGRPQSGLEGSVAAPALRSQVVGEVQLPVEGGQVTARLLQVGDGARLELQTRTTRAVEIVARYDPQLMNYLDGAGTGQPSAPGQLTLPADVGARRRTVDFDGIGPVTIEVRAGDRTVAEATLAAPPPR